MSWVTDVTGASTAGAAIAEAEGASAATAGAATAAAGAAEAEASFLEIFLAAGAGAGAAAAAGAATATVSFFATFFAEAAAGLWAELFVLVPVVIFDIFERTGTFSGERTSQFLVWATMAAPAAAPCRPFFY